MLAKSGAEKTIVPCHRLCSSPRPFSHRKNKKHTTQHRPYRHDNERLSRFPCGIDRAVYRKAKSKHRSIENSNYLVGLNAILSEGTRVLEGTYVLGALGNLSCHSGTQAAGYRCFYTTMWILFQSSSRVFRPLIMSCCRYSRPRITKCAVQSTQNDILVVAAEKRVLKRPEFLSRELRCLVLRTWFDRSPTDSMRVFLWATISVAYTTNPASN
jgi:hypothetical protein